MNELQIFQNSEFGELGVLEINGKPHFPATACAKMLGYANPKDAIKRHCKGGVKHDLLTKGGMQTLNFVPEGDLYRLIVHSKLPTAERFEKWVFDEVLPTIRKTGGYRQSVSAEVLSQLITCTQVLTQSVQLLTQEVAAIKAGQQATQPVQVALAGDTAEFMDSMEVARILGRPHNNVLKGIRATVERARLEGILVDAHFVICYRTHWNNVRCPYYRLDETAITMFSSAMKNLTLAEKLRTTFREQNR